MLGKVHIGIIDFFFEEARIEEFEGKRVLEVGSRYVNGSVRPFVEKFLHPKEYVGVDIADGKYVDEIVNAEQLAGHFGSQTFDVVISTEMLEHVKDWRRVTRNLKEVLKPGGYLYLTTVALGFMYHQYPFDFWRFLGDDLKAIFSDFEVKTVIEDSKMDATYLKAVKPYSWKPAELDQITLYSILTGRPEREIPLESEIPFQRRVAMRLLSWRYRQFLPQVITLGLARWIAGDKLKVRSAILD